MLEDTILPYENTKITTNHKFGIVGAIHESTESILCHCETFLRMADLRNTGGYYPPLQKTTKLTTKHKLGIVGAIHESTERILCHCETFLRMADWWNTEIIAYQRDVEDAIPYKTKT